MQGELACFAGDLMAERRMNGFVWVPGLGVQGEQRKHTGRKNRETSANWPVKDNNCNHKTILPHYPARVIKTGFCISIQNMSTFMFKEFKRKLDETELEL